MRGDYIGVCTAYYTKFRLTNHPQYESASPLGINSSAAANVVLPRML